MAFIEAQTGPPPGAPAQPVEPCPHQGPPPAYLTVLVRNKHAAGTPALANTNVQVTVGAESHTLNTDGNGLVTFVYEAAGNFANQAVAVVLTDASRAWLGQAQTGNATAVAVTVAGTFTLKVELYTDKPGVGVMPWPHAWTTNLAISRSSTPPAQPPVAASHPFLAFDKNAVQVDELRNLTLDCVSTHVLKVPFNGFLDTSEVRLCIDGGAELVAAAEAENSDVKYSKQALMTSALAVQRNGAQLLVKFVFRFKQVMVVGEGTNFEYATGLASKYADALSAKGLRWVLATQYDVTPVAQVPMQLRIRDWMRPKWIAEANMRQRVTNGIARNLINHAAQFDATDAGHWAAVLNTYGAFDAVLFNNPHPGYGMHMCEVMGLVDEGGLRYKNGQAISVYSFGFGRPMTSVEKGKLGFPAPATFLAQRNFVRGNAVNQLNYQNLLGQAVNFQYSRANSTARALTVANAFTYLNGAAIDAAWFGHLGEMGEGKDGATSHYKSKVSTLGLHGYLLRCYRYHGPSVLKDDGWLFVNGSEKLGASLCDSFSFNGQRIDAMTNDGAWLNPLPGRELDQEYFVFYNTNFTSTAHHPSWYSQLDFKPGEPNIAHAKVYKKSK